MLFKLKFLFTAFFTVIVLSGCVTVHDIDTPLPTEAELAQLIDEQFEGDVNKYFKKAHYFSPDKVYWPAPVRFAHDGRKDLLQVLKDRGWDPNKRIKGRYHTLRHAIGETYFTYKPGTGSTRAVETLIDFGVDPDNLVTDCENKERCSSALTAAVIWGKPDMIKPILEGSDKPHWKELHPGVRRERFEQVRNYQPTGKDAMEWAVRRGMQFENFRNQQAGFASAFADAGYGQQYKVAMQKVNESKAKRAQQQAQARAQQSSEGGGWTKDLMAMGAGALIGASVVGEADFLGALGDGSGSAMDYVGMMMNVADDLADSESGGSNIGNIVTGGGAASANTASPSNANAAGGGAKTFSINEQYRATCPDGRKTSQAVPIQTNIPACAKAKRTLARAAGCNLFEDMSEAHAAYKRACASEMFQ